MFSDNIRQLESLASADLVPQATVDVLTHAYRAYRQRMHHLSLEAAEQPSCRPRNSPTTRAAGRGNLARHDGVADSPYNPGQGAPK